MGAKLGAGLAPAGTSVFGYGQPATTTRVLKQPFLSSDGQTVSNARSINPATRDYNLDASGRSVGMNSMQQQVYLALVTTKGTSVDTQMGSEVGLIRVIRKNTPSEIDAAVRNALGALTSSGKITIVSIESSTDNQIVSLRVKWSDSSGLVNTTTING